MGAIPCALAAAVNWPQFLQSYLVAYVFWLSVCLGAGGLLALNYVVKCRWGVVIRRTAEAAAALIFLMALLLLPLLAGLPHLYQWARPEGLSADPALRHAALFLQVPFVLGRLALYFLIWFALAFLLKHWSVQQDQRGDPACAKKLSGLSAVSVPIYVLTISFFSVDMLLSLEPGWDSSIVGFMIGTDCLLTALAFIIVIVVLLAKDAPLRQALNTERVHDLGNLLMALVIFWAYIAFAQYLVLWMANLPEEVGWYVRRTQGGWEWAARSLMGLHFALPLFLLLFRFIKRSTGSLIAVALFMLVMRWVDLLWTIAPTFRPVLYVHWLDVALPLAMGGLWVAVFGWVLRRQPLLPLHAEVVDHGAEAAPAAEAI
ncbi:MAG TPA: hypothetical protein VGP72_17870 [Planctomycetota bacterium]